MIGKDGVLEEGGADDRYDRSIEKYGDSDAAERRSAREERRARNKAAWAEKRRLDAIQRCVKQGHTRGYKRGIKECARCGAEPKLNEGDDDAGGDISSPVVDEDAVAAVDGGLFADKESASDED